MVYSKNICFEAIWYGGKSNIVLWAWKEVHHQILDGCEVKFTEECMMCTEKEIFTNGLNMDLPLQSRIKDST